MAASNQRRSNVKAARNGHAKDMAPPDDTVPDVKSTTGTSVTPSPYVTRYEEGPAAPGDTVARPVHPVLEGPLYSSNIPSRESRYPLSITEEAFKRFAEDFPLRAVELRLLQDEARHATQRARETQQTLIQALQARQKKAELACKDFISHAAEVETAMMQATASERTSLVGVEQEIADVGRMALLAHARPGVPRAETARRIGVTVRSAKSATPSQKETSADSLPIQTLSAKKASSADAESFTPGWIKASKVGLGAAVGLAFGMNQRFIVLHEMRQLKICASHVWAPLWMLVGVGAISLLTAGLGKWWLYAGERRTEELPSDDIFYWRAMRHTFLPLLVTALVCAMEAAILRNAQVSSLLIKDPGNWMYLVGNFALILPATLHASASGWTQGCALKADQMQEEKNILKRTEMDQIIAGSADAQRAFALDDYLVTLQERHTEIQGNIEISKAPYQTLLSQYLAEMKAPAALTDEENQILMASIEDAKVANLIFKQRLAQYEDAFEPLPNTPATSSLTLCFVRTTNGDLVPPPAKRSLWQRMKAFFKQRRERRAKRKEEEVP